MALAHPTKWDYLKLLYLAAAWGGSFLFVKLAVDTMAPLTITMWRVGLAAAILVVIAKWRGLSLSFSPKEWAWISLMGVLGNSLPFTLINWGVYYVPAGLAAILMAMTPLTTMIMAHFFIAGDRLNRRKAIGLLCGSTGIVVLVGVEALAGVGDAVLAQIAITFAAFSYAAASIAAKQVANTGRPPLATGAAGLIVSFITITPVAFLLEDPMTQFPTGIGFAAILYLAIFPTAIATLVLLNILERVGPAFLSLNNYMVPVFGVFYGAVFLSESLGANALVALIFILGGIFIAGRQRKPEPAS